MEFPRFKKWNREEYTRAQRLIDLDGYELIDGEVVEKVVNSDGLTNSALSLWAWLCALDASRCASFPSVDVALADRVRNCPKPDLVLLRESLAGLAGCPGPDDIGLLVELSDATLSFDLTLKRDLYARAAIADYWVVDVPNRRVVVHRDPAEGQYRSITEYAEADSVSLLAMPGYSAVVRDLF